MGFILSIPIPRIAINRVGTIDLEHLFGVTRHQTAGNNDAGRIMGAFLKSNLVAQLADKWGRILRRKRHRSLGGIYDGMLQGLELHHLFDVLGNPLGGAPWLTLVLFQVFKKVGGNAAAIDDNTTFIECRNRFAALLGVVKDCQKVSVEICLTECGRIYWTANYFDQLRALRQQHKTPEEAASFFHISVEEIERGWKKLLARMRVPVSSYRTDRLDVLESGRT
jgi:hypothetical protein